MVSLVGWEQKLTVCNYGYNKIANHSVQKRCNHSSTMETIAERIKRCRIERKLTQEELANRLNISRVAVTKWETGEVANMKLSNLMGLSRVFKMPVEEIITGISPYKSLDDDLRSKSTLKHVEQDWPFCMISREEWWSASKSIRTAAEAVAQTVLQTEIK